jgi:hypothetical protein
MPVMLGPAQGPGPRLAVIAARLYTPITCSGMGDFGSMGAGGSAPKIVLPTDGFRRAAYVRCGRW